MQAGRKIGTETFEITSGGGRVTARGHVDIRTLSHGKAVGFHTDPVLILDSQLNPLTYTWRQTDPHHSSLRITFQSSPARVVYHTLKGQRAMEDFYLPKDVVILDDNVFAQYQLLADRYEMTAGGTQKFKVFVPQEASPGTVTVASAGNARIPINGKSLKLRHLVVTTTSERLDLFVDRRGRLQEVSVPMIDFDVIRQK